MWFRDPDTVEYWFDLDASLLVMSLHSVVKNMESDKYARILNIIVEFVQFDKNYNKIYAMIVIKSLKHHTKFSLIEMLRKNLIGNENNTGWRSGR